MTLGKLIEMLSRYPDDMVCMFDFCQFIPKGLDSYRGYYEDLAIGYSETGERMPVKDLIAMLKDAIWKTFEGYKGGDFIMNESTEVLVSSYGSADRTKITGMYSVDDILILQTGYAE